MTDTKNVQANPGSPEDVAHKARARRNLAIAVSLGALVVIFFIVTLVQLGGNIAQRTH